jgi:3-oxoacyl-[acyl-carrier protein] reductase
VLVNNAGTAIPKRFEDTTLEELDRVIDINVRGTFIATQAALKHMKSGGRIIMIGWCVGERNMTPGLVPYSATKGVLKMFTQGLSREVGTRGITVNNIQPGPIDTDLNPAAGLSGVTLAFLRADGDNHKPVVPSDAVLGLELGDASVGV